MVHSLSISSVVVGVAAALLLSQSAAQDGVGVDLCACQPTSITFQLNFSAVCAENNIEGPGIFDAACVISKDDGVTDEVPTAVSSVTFEELAGANLAVVDNTTLEEGYADGDEISYASIIERFPENITADNLPRGLRVYITGTNANDETLVNQWIIIYDNSCGVFPVVSAGQQIGWSSFTEMGTPDEQFCPQGVGTLSPNATDVPVPETNGTSTVAPTPDSTTAVPAPNGTTSAPTPIGTTTAPAAPEDGASTSAPTPVGTTAAPEPDGSTSAPTSGSTTSVPATTAEPTAVGTSTTSPPTPPSTSSETTANPTSTVTEEPVAAPSTDVNGPPTCPPHKDSSGKGKGSGGKGKRRGRLLGTGQGEECPEPIKKKSGSNDKKSDSDVKKAEKGKGASMGKGKGKSDEEGGQGKVAMDNSTMAGEATEQPSDTTSSSSGEEDSSNSGGKGSSSGKGTAVTSSSGKGSSNGSDKAADESSNDQKEDVPATEPSGKGQGSKGMGKKRNRGSTEDLSEEGVRRHWR